MGKSWLKIWAIFVRYFMLHWRSLPRCFEIFFWPVMDLLVWGFVTLYIQREAPGNLGRMVVFFLGSLILWDILYRAQQAVTLPLIEEIWTRNIINLLVSPLKLWEWLAGTFLYGIFKIAIIGTVLAVLASLLYGFSIWALGPQLIGFVTLLICFGWGLGLVTCGLLVRWGHAAESLIWAVPFLVQPFSAVFYPISILPHWMQSVAKFLPSTEIFEGMRQVVKGETVSGSILLHVALLDVIWFSIGLSFFCWMFGAARSSGKLVRLGLD